MARLGEVVRIAITGTPGCGKTTLARVLRERLGWHVVDVKAWAHAESLVVGHDEQDMADVIDVDRLAERVPPDAGEPIVYEGHLSHLLGLDAIWVIRCDPVSLLERLRARDYTDVKIRENLEAEALDIILQESLDEGVPVVQRDGTRRSPDELLASFVESKAASLRSHDLEPVDWSDRLPLPDPLPPAREPAT